MHHGASLLQTGSAYGAQIWIAAYLNLIVAGWQQPGHRHKAQGEKYLIRYASMLYP
jgi:hypothetical protein